MSNLEKIMNNMDNDDKIFILLYFISVSIIGIITFFI